MKVKYKIKQITELPIGKEDCIPGTKVRFKGMTKEESKAMSFTGWETHYKIGQICIIHPNGYSYKAERGHVVYLEDPTGSAKRGFFVPLHCVRRIVEK